MRRHPLIWAIAILAVLAVAAYVVFAVRAASKIGAGWAGLGSAWPYLAAGVLTVGVAVAAFLRLAFLSQSKGFDDRADEEHRRTGA